jgi:transcription initiation factor TFIID subunit 2
MDDGIDDAAAATAFTVLNQRIELDFSFCPRRVTGKTTIEIQPQSHKLREIHVNCRQLKPTSVYVRGTSAAFHYDDLYDRLSLFPGTNIHQHHFPQNRLRKHESGEAEELVIFVPEKLRIKDVRSPGGPEAVYETLAVQIEYTLDNFRDAVHFVGVEDGDMRYPHAFTRNSPFAGMASSLFPCVDDGSTRGHFEVLVRYPRTVGDALGKTLGAGAIPQTNGDLADGEEDDGDGFTEEERALEMTVICSGVLTDEIADPEDHTRMTSTFSIETTVGVLPQHIGIVLGPFQHVDLSEYRDTSEDDRLQDEAIKVHAFCLPGREDEVRNSAMMVPKTLDSFTDHYQTYRFGKSYKMAFVDDLDCDTAHTMSMTICSSRLLFPGPVWEPLEHTTRALVHAVASQWIGVDIIAQTPRDHWVIVGGSWWMAEFHLRDLFGKNAHRFRQKKIVDTTVQMDVRRPCLYDLGEFLQLDPGEQEFMQLKSLSVLSILHNRLVKASGKNGMDRCIYRMLFNHGNGSYANGAISTEAFMSNCEKVGHQKLDTFFRQWVFGAGCPIFECFQNFNKKKQVVALTIRQTQSDPSVLPDNRGLESAEFMREAKERSRGLYTDSEPPAFVGPMTIRIHEADGTPYEHIVEINSNLVKVEIPYNTKYKRLKRNRLQKERQAAAQGVSIDASGEQQEDVTLYTLGDIFQEPEQVEEWNIMEKWDPLDEQSMDNAAYEWIRADADFEWITKMTIDMPSYMFHSQLQQDKDVVAQAESLQYFSTRAGHPLLSSIMIKTLMDHRYFHAIRTMAAELLVNMMTDFNDVRMIGLFHLKKAFQELFCMPGSTMTRANDFENRALYLIQCTIPKAIARVKGPDGKTPMEVKSFLLDLVRYNDNRGNAYSDDHYISELMKCLTETITSGDSAGRSGDVTEDLLAESEEHDFRTKALDELQRHLRFDEWVPTFQNIYTRTVLDCEVKLIQNGVKPLKVNDFLQYTHAGNAENVRLKAWECLVNLGIFSMKNSVIRYFIHTMQSDPSPYFRSEMLRRFETAVGQMAVGEAYVPEVPKELEQGGSLIEDPAVTHARALARAARLTRKTLDGAIQGLKADFQNNETLQQSIEEALGSKIMSVGDVSDLLNFVNLVVEPVDELQVKLMYPWYYKVERVDGSENELLMRFTRTRVRTVSTHPRQQPTALEPSEDVSVPPQPSGPANPKLKLKWGGPKTSSNGPPSAGPPSAESRSAEPQPSAQATPVPASPTGPAEVRNRLQSTAGLPGLQSNHQKDPTPPATVAPPIVAKATPRPEPTPQPAQAPPTETSTPMEGVEMAVVPSPKPSLPSTPAIPSRDPTPKPTEPPKATPKPSPAATPARSSATPAPSSSAPSAKPASVKPAPKIKVKLGIKPPAAPKTPKPPKPSKSGPSLIVKLRVPGDKLRAVEAGVPSKKRKAEKLAAGERPAKRQSTDPGASVNGSAGMVEVRNINSPGWGPRLMVKVRSARLGELKLQ